MGTEYKEVLTDEEITRAYHNIPIQVPCKTDTPFIIDRGRRIEKAILAKLKGGEHGWRWDEVEGEYFPL